MISYYNSDSREAQKVCLDAEVEEALINIKIELRSHRDVTMEGKNSRYER